MNKAKALLVTAVFFSSILPGGLNSSLAQNLPSSTPSGTPSNTPSANPTTASGTAILNEINDAALINFLHHMNSGEINEANSALGRLTKQQAISFAQTMLTDHQQNEQQVTQLATQKNLTLYAYQPSTVEIAIDAQLDQVADADYDLAYLNVQLVEHQKALEDLKLLRGQVTDPDLMKLADQSISLVEKHINLAKSAINQITAGGTASPQPSSSPQAGRTPTPSSTPQPSITPEPSSSAQPVGMP